jgi:hypothetical protein
MSQVNYMMFEQNRFVLNAVQLLDFWYSTFLFRIFHNTIDNVFTNKKKTLNTKNQATEQHSKRIDLAQTSNN